MNLAEQAKNVASAGRMGDTTLLHLNPVELKGLASMVPLTINPDTGYAEAFLPLLALAAMGAVAGGGGTALQGGDMDDIWKGALIGGALGGAGGVAAGALAPAAAAGAGGGLGATTAATGTSSALAGGGAGTGAGVGAGVGAGAAPVAGTAGFPGAAGPAGMTLANTAPAVTAAPAVTPVAGAAPGAGVNSGIGGLFGGNKGALLAAGAPMAMSLVPGGGGGSSPKKRKSGPAKRYTASRDRTGEAPDPGASERRYFSEMQFTPRAYGGLVRGYADGGPVGGGLGAGSAPAFGDAARGGKGATGNLRELFASQMRQASPESLVRRGSMPQGQPVSPGLPFPVGSAPPPPISFTPGLPPTGAFPVQPMTQLQVPAVTPGPSIRNSATLKPMRGSERAYGGLVRGYANGGITDMIAPGGQGQADEVTMGAVAAIRGSHPNPKEAIRVFIETYGPEAFEALMQQVMAGGRSDGLSDSIPASNPDGSPAALSEGEYVVPADAVADMGNGSTEAGGRGLDSLVQNLRQSRHGTGTPPDQIDPNMMIPA